MRCCTYFKHSVFNIQNLYSYMGLMATLMDSKDFILFRFLYSVQYNYKQSFPPYSPEFLTSCRPSLPDFPLLRVTGRLLLPLSTLHAISNPRIFISLEHLLSTVCSHIPISSPEFFLQATPPTLENLRRNCCPQ